MQRILSPSQIPGRIVVQVIQIQSAIQIWYNTAVTASTIVATIVERLQALVAKIMPSVSIPLKVAARPSMKGMSGLAASLHHILNVWALIPTNA